MWMSWVRTVLGAFLLGAYVAEPARAQPQACDGLKDVLFIVDSSESILDDDPPTRPYYTWDTLRQFIGTVVSLLPVAPDQTRVAALKYASTAHVEFGFNGHLTSINAQDAVTEMSHLRGNTNTALALRTAQEHVFVAGQGDRPTADNVIILITDGLDTVEAENTLVQAKILHGNHTEIFAVAYSEEVLEYALLQLVTEPKDRHLVLADTVAQLLPLADLLARRVCGLPDPKERPPVCAIQDCLQCDTNSKCKLCDHGKFFDGRLCSDCMQFCALCQNTTTCQQCMVGWYWETTTNSCEECEVQADLALVIDGSGSIRDKNPDDDSYDNWAILKEFLKNLLDRLDIGPYTTRVGTVKFSTDAKTIFHLDKFTSRQDMKNAIDGMTHDNGHTNTSGGLRVMREDIFQTAHGDRPSVRNVGIVVTDGESTRDANLTLLEAERARLANVTLFVVGVTDQIDVNELKAIASDPDSEHYFNSTEIRLLDTIIYQLIKHVCTPTNPAAGVLLPPAEVPGSPHRGRRNIQGLMGEQKKNEKVP